MNTRPHQQIEDDTTRATARLPGLEIEIVQRRPATADFEQISINLRAAPSFEAFGQFLATTDPYAFWLRAMQIAWLPWLGAARALALPWGVALGQLGYAPEETRPGALKSDDRGTP